MNFNCGDLVMTTYPKDKDPHSPAELHFVDFRSLSCVIRLTEPKPKQPVWNNTNTKWFKPSITTIAKFLQKNKVHPSLEKDFQVALKKLLIEQFGKPTKEFLDELKSLEADKISKEIPKDNLTVTKDNSLALKELSSDLDVSSNRAPTPSQKPGVSYTEEPLRNGLVRYL